MGIGNYYSLELIESDVFFDCRTSLSNTSPLILGVNSGFISMSIYGAFADFYGAKTERFYRLLTHPLVLL